MKTVDTINTLILAGRRKKNPLEEAFQVENKSFINIHGQYSISYVLDAVYDYDPISCIYLGVAPEQRELFQRHISQPFHIIDSFEEESPVNVIVRALRRLPEGSPLLVTTSDNTFLSGDDIKYFLSHARQADILIATVNGCNELIEDYPQMRNQRTWHKLNSQTWLSGANLFYINITREQIDSLEEILAMMEANRKSPLSFCWSLLSKSPLQALFFLKYVLRAVSSLEEVDQFLSKGLNTRVKLITMPKSKLCIDLDTEEDYKFISEQLVVAQI